MKAENMNFSDRNVHEIQNKVINVLWNVYGFYALYVENRDQKKKSKVSNANYQLSTLHVMDRWLLSKAAHLVREVTAAMDTYDVVTASRLLIEFTNEFSTWYLRLSRERLKSGEQEESGHVFARVLVLTCKLFAPFIPFITESIFQNISDGGVSIHLTDWPVFEDLKAFSNEKLEEQMQLVQMATEAAHGVRKDQKLKVRQPLASLTVTTKGESPAEELADVLAKEVNVEKVEWLKGDEFSIDLDTVITPELERKGQMREAIRTIQDLRKNGQVSVDAYVNAWLPAWPEEWEAEIKKKTLVKELQKGEARIVLI